jgi:hypothetical protein
MLPFRAIILVLTLGSATVIGWLCSPARPAVAALDAGRPLDRPAIHPFTTHAHGRHCFPGRQRTNPDPTPDDWGVECSGLVTLIDSGPDWAAFEAAGLWTTCSLLESPSWSWVEPAEWDHPLQVNRRFRC